MVVAQSAERLVVVQEVAGSTPVDHPEEKGRYGSSHNDPFTFKILRFPPSYPFSLVAPPILSLIKA